MLARKVRHVGRVHLALASAPAIHAGEDDVLHAGLRSLCDYRRSLCFLFSCLAHSRDEEHAVDRSMIREDARGRRVVPFDDGDAGFRGERFCFYGRRVPGQGKDLEGCRAGDQSSMTAPPCLPVAPVISSFLSAMKLEEALFDD